MTTVTFEWKGDRVLDRVNRAVGRSQVAWGEQITSGMKSRVHRLTGTLSRSLHAAKKDYDGSRDEDIARAGAVAMSAPDPPTGGKAIVEAGSWISYALYEMARGGDHDFATDAFRTANERYQALLERALQEEGLR